MIPVFQSNHNLGNSEIYYSSLTMDAGTKDQSYLCIMQCDLPIALSTGTEKILVE